MKLKFCPFCGGQPSFSDPEWKDDRRYVEIELRCCVVMTDSLPWGSAKGMDHSAITEHLRTALTVIWNDRYVPDPEDLVEDPEPEHASEQAPNFARF